MHVCVHLAEQLVGVSVELSVQIQHAADEIVELGVAAGAESTEAGRSNIVSGGAHVTMPIVSDICFMRIWPLPGKRFAPLATPICSAP